MADEQEPLMRSSEEKEGAEASLHPRRWWCSWRNLKFILLPIEVCAFLFLFAVYFNVQVYQQYFYQRIMKHEIDVFNNVTTDDKDSNFENGIICLDQDTITNLSSQAVFLKGQKEVNRINMITTLISLSLSLIASLFLVPYSDVFGRKPFLALVFLGQAAGTVISLIIVYFNLNMYYFILSSIANGLGGSFGIMLAACSAYVTDITPLRWLAVRMAILGGVIFVGSASASSASDKWIQTTNCDFRPMIWLILGTALSGLVFSLILPESLNSDVKSKSTQTSRKRGIRSLIRGFKIFTSLSYVSPLTLLKLWITVGITVLTLINETGGFEIIGYFLHNKPLEWDYTTIGNYIAVSSVAHMLALIVILPLLVVAKFPNTVIMSIGIAFALLFNLLIAALVKKTWEMFLVGVISGLEALVAPSLRSYIALLVKKEDIGATFSVMAAFQLLGTLIATVVFNLIYTPQTTQSIHHLGHSPRLVYWVSSGLWAAGLLLSLPLIFFRDKKTAVTLNDHIQ